MTQCIPDGLYAIADTQFGDPLELARMFALQGIRVVQLRAKDWGTAQRVAVGRALVEQLGPLGMRVIMNDDIDAAVDADTDGVHLGQHDGDIEEARTRLAAGRLVGRSTHTLAQAIQAAQTADYIGFGPVFSTRTKKAAGEARGLDLLRQVVRSVDVPVVAIGGISRSNLSQVHEVGARHWAVISDILQDARPHDRLGELLDLQAKLANR